MWQGKRPNACLQIPIHTRLEGNNNPNVQLTDMYV